MLYVVGYVDYIDVFGGHQRGGYARVYDPALDTGPEDARNNLAFVTDRAYNYDRPREEGEGDDWGLCWFRLRGALPPRNIARCNSCQSG